MSLTMRLGKITIYGRALDNMRVLLVNPFYPISETPSPPLGLAFLAAALERAGVEVRVLDLVVFPYTKKRLEKTLKEFLPNIVGLTSVTMTLDNALQVARDVKSIDPEILTIMGGPHVTFCAEDTMRLCPDLDFIALGEGEETIVDLVRATDKRRDWENIAGLVYRRGSDIHNNGPIKDYVEVNSLPAPARHLLPLGRYRALNMPVSMTTSRGCPFKCVFCVGRKMVGAKIRYWNPETVVDEFERLSALGFSQINIADDLFTANPKHCLEVCRGILKRGVKAKWSAFARVDTVSREVLVKMKEAGCAAVSFGVETGNPGIMKTIRKGITLDQVITAVRMCSQAGITPHASFILGLPGETPETLRETVDFCERLKEMGAYHGFHLLAPFPGTRIRDESGEFGLKILTNDWREYHANKAIVETPSVSREMLDKIVREWEQEFDDWLAEIKKLREKGEAAKEDAWQLTSLENTVLIHDLMMKRIIEEKGAWQREREPYSDSHALDNLADIVASATDNPRDLVFRVLSYAVERGDLKFTEKNEWIRWAWVDYL